VKIEPSLHDIYRLSAGWKNEGFRVALVPTMGCLHEGHLSLMRKAREVCDKVIVSIFVNPTQFGPNEDLDSYPRQLKLDCELAKNEGVDAVFCPESSQMYTEAAQTRVSVQSLSLGLCGADRPGHFDGVATVVSKLLNLTIPDVAIFGEKDFQQLAVIRQLVKDLNFNIEIIGYPIVREVDGLAMSSRNKYLKGESRNHALCLYNSIMEAQKLVKQTSSNLAAEVVINQTKKIITRAGAEVEYAVVVNEFSLKNDEFINSNSVLAVAAKINGSVRLIDNAKLWPAP